MKTSYDILSTCRTFTRNGVKWIRFNDAINAINLEMFSKKPDPSDNPTLEDILNEVSYYTGVPVKEIMERKRGHQNICVARQIYFYRARMLTHHSLSEIGGLVGKDHATTMHGIKVVKEVPQVRDYYLELFEGKKKKTPVVLNKDLMIPVKRPIIEQIPQKRGEYIQPYSGYKPIPAMQ